MWRLRVFTTGGGGGGGSISLPQLPQLPLLPPPSQLGGGGGGAPFVLPDFSPCPQVDGANWVWVVIFIPGQSGDYPSVCLPGSNMVTTPEVGWRLYYHYYLYYLVFTIISQRQHRNLSFTMYFGTSLEGSTLTYHSLIHFWTLFMTHFCMNPCWVGSDQVQVNFFLEKFCSH